MVAGQGEIALDGVTRRFEVDAEQAITALDGVTLSIPEGAAVALSGPSGSGKSTLLHVVGALEHADTGTVTVGGRSLGELSRRELAAHRRRIGFVFQRFNLLPALTVVDNVMAPVLPYRVPFDKRERAYELLAAVGLEGRETSLPSRLSGGQQQRVAIARALITQPSIILADEPTGNLDTRTSIEVMGIFQRLNIERGITIILITHEMDIAEYGTRLVRFRDGKIQVDQKIANRRDAAKELAALPPPEPDLQTVVGDPVPAEHLGGVV